MSPKRVAKMSPKRVAKMSPKRVAKIQPQSSTYMEDKIINTEKIKEIAKKSMNDIGGYLKTTGEKVKDVTGNVVEKVKDVTENVVEKVKDVTGNVVEKLYEIDSEDEKTPTKATKQSEPEEPEEPVKAEEPFKEKWELYTMDDCIFCKNAKDVLEGRVAEDPENKSLKIEKGYENTDPVVIEWVAKYGDGWPKIFLNGKFIGGYSNLEATFKEINNGSI